ncbi:hypothetical protein [Paenibacillus sp. FSL M7-0420]|uniref:hypothetical protein n=1 Tax=Paenibacillus sp. FSL M7-0420 TaxID=2921609 RepID=UPI0030F74F11
MTTETQRDLHADLALCTAVPEVYYDEGGGYTASSLSDAATQFFEEAPVAWPHAIERAIKAEKDRDYWKFDAESKSIRVESATIEALTYAKENEILRSAMMHVFQAASVTERQRSQIIRSQCALSAICSRSFFRRWWNNGGE